MVLCGVGPCRDWFVVPKGLVYPLVCVVTVRFEKEGKKTGCCIIVGKPGKVAAEMDEEFFINIEDARPGRQAEGSPPPQNRERKSRVNREPFNPVTICCYLFLVAVLGVFPLYSTHSYDTLAMAKYEFFCTATLCFLGISAVVGAVVFFYNPKRYFQTRVLPPSVTDIAMFLFFAVAGLSCLFSKYQEVAFHGSDYRHHGFVMIIMYLLVYFLLSRSYQHQRWILYIFILSSCLVVWIGLQNFLGQDPLGFLAHSSNFQARKSISTIGNKNFFASYLCIFMPVAMVLFVKTRKVLDATLCAVGMLFGFGGLVVSGSDSGFLGVAVLVLLVPLVVKNFQELARYFFSLAVFFASAPVVGLFMKDPKVNLRYKTDVISRTLIEGDKTVILLALFLMLGVLFVIAYLVKPQVTIHAAVKWIYGAIVGLAVLAVLGMFFWFSVVDIETQLGDWENYLRFGDYWGSTRGYAWRRLWEIYQEFSVQDKLFGSGMDTVGNLLVPRYYTEMITRFGLYFENAHNEYLQYLVTTGLLGVTAYVVTIASSVARTLKNGMKNPAMLAVGFAVLCYAVQGVVNISQTMTTPLFFVMLGLAESFNRRVKRERRMMRASMMEKI